MINIPLKLSLLIVLVILLISLINCSDRRSSYKFIGSTEICKGITKEVYLAGSWGAFSADTYADYLTDSTNFRVFIGKRDENEGFEYDCHNDSIFIFKFVHNEPHAGKITHKLVGLDLAKLRLEHRFD